MKAIRTEDPDASPSILVAEKTPDQEQLSSRFAPWLVRLNWLGCLGRGIECALDCPALRGCIRSYKAVMGPVWALDKGHPIASSVAVPQTMGYNRKPVDDAIESYLRSIDHSAKAREIAEAIDYHRSYVGKRCRVMADEGILDREEGGFIIGHDIPGRDNPTILNSDRTYLLDIVQEHEPELLSEARSMSVRELRKLIKREIATATYPLGNRTVSYSTG